MGRNFLQSIVNAAVVKTTTKKPTTKKPTTKKPTTKRPTTTTTTKSPYISVQCFTYTNASGGVSVPAEASYVMAIVAGQSGSNNIDKKRLGGKGGLVGGTFPVTPGQSVGFYVAGPGYPNTAPAFGTGGGGCSAVVDNSLNIMLIAGGGGGASSTANGTDSNANLAKYYTRGNDINVVGYAIAASNGDFGNGGTGGTIGVIGGGIFSAYGVPPDAFQPYQHGGWSGGGPGKGICGGGGGNLGQGGGVSNTRGTGNAGDGGSNFANNKVTVLQKRINNITTQTLPTLFPGLPSKFSSIPGVSKITSTGQAFVILAFLRERI